MKSAIYGLSLLTATCFGFDALAQQKAVQAKSGEEVRIGVYGSLKSSETCLANPAPQVRVMKPAAHGTITLKRARLKTDRFKQCPDVQIPVVVAFYNSTPGYTGTDEVELSVAMPEKTLTPTISLDVR